MPAQFPPITQGQCYASGESRQTRLDSLNQEAFRLAPQLKDPATREQAMNMLREAAQRLCLEPKDVDEAARQAAGGRVGPQIQTPGGTPPTDGTEPPHRSDRFSPRERPGHPQSLPFR